MADIKPGKDFKSAGSVKPAAPVAPKPAVLAGKPAPAVTKPALTAAKPAPIAAKPVPAPAAKPAPAPKASPAPVVAASVTAAAKPVEALAAAPVHAAEATRAVAEETGAALSRAAETIVGAVQLSVADTATHPLKGFFAMATTFDPKSFAPNGEAVTSLFGDIQGRAKSQLEKSAKIVEEMRDFAKGNVEAMMASGRVAAKGTETLAQEAAEYGKKSFESATAAFKSFASAKSPTELFKLQSDYARASFDAMVAESSKVTEAWLKLAGEVAQPLSSRVAVAAEKVKAPIAG